MLIEVNYCHYRSKTNNLFAAFYVFDKDDAHYLCHSFFVAVAVVDDEDDDSGSLVFRTMMVTMILSNLLLLLYSAVVSLASAMTSMMIKNILYGYYRYVVIDDVCLFQQRFL